MSRYCHSLGFSGGGGVVVVQRHVKTLTFSNISVITEDIYLKLRVVVQYQKGTHTSWGGNPSIFWTKLCPFFDLESSKCSYSQALAPACSALVYDLGLSFLFYVSLRDCFCYLYINLFRYYFL